MIEAMENSTIARIVASILATLLTTSCTNSKSAERPKMENGNMRASCEAPLPLMDQIHRTQLLDLSKWFISEALPRIYAEGESDFVEDRVEKSGFWMYSDVLVERNGILALFVVKSDNLVNQVECFKRSRQKEKNFELWVVKQWGRNIETFRIETAGLLLRRQIRFSQKKKPCTYPISS